MKLQSEFNNKMALQKQLEVLDRQKSMGNFELLSKEGNPLLAKFAKNLKQKAEGSAESKESPKEGDQETPTPGFDKGGMFAGLLA